MTHRTRSFALAGAVLGSLALTGLARAADAAEPTPEELLERARKLIEQAEAQKAARADAASSDKAAALGRVLADAEQRSGPKPLTLGTTDTDTDTDANADRPAMLQDVPEEDDLYTAGHNGKFFLSSPDGAFTLIPNFQLQVRHVANFAPLERVEVGVDTDGDGVDDDTEVQELPVGDAFDDVDFGFEIRRAKIGFEGNAFSEELEYDLKFAFNRDSADDGEAVVFENAFIDYKPENGLFGTEGLGFRIGQFKDPTFFEEVVSSSRQLGVDRSLVNEEIGGGETFFIQGAGLLLDRDKVSAYLGYADGFNSANTDYLDRFADLQVGIHGRVDVVVLGENDRPFRDFTALETDADAARVGAGAFLELDDTGDDVQIELFHTIDAQYETGNGLALFGAFFGDYFDEGDEDGYNAGALAKVAQVLDKEAGWEVFGQYSFVVFDQDIGGEDFFHEVVAGVNKYWESHKVKMTIDAGLLPNGNPGSNTGIGYRNDGASDEMQLTIRGQFQLLL